MDTKIGILHEIGDLGLGFNEATEDEQATLEKKKEEEKESKN